MKSVYINDSLHRRAKSLAAAQSIPLNQFIERLLERALDTSQPDKASGKPRLQEPPVDYDTATAARQVETKANDPWYDEMVAQGRLIPPEQVRQQLRELSLRIWKELGLDGPPLGEPPTIEDVQAMFRHQRELHPDMPTSWKILRQMREEE